MTQVLPTHIVRWATEDYPRALAELEAHFSTEEACREYLFRLRWSNGFLALLAVEERPGPLEKFIAVQGFRVQRFKVDFLVKPEPVNG